jgi:hypothetical protein
MQLSSSFLFKRSVLFPHLISHALLQILCNGLLYLNRHVLFHEILNQGIMVLVVLRNCPQLGVSL